MKLWPDLSRFGFKLGLLYQPIPGGSPKVSGLYFELLSGASISLAATIKTIEAIKQAGWTPVDPVGGSPYRLETGRTKFAVQELATWFSGFDEKTDMKEGVPSSLASQPSPAIIPWQLSTDWPRPDDLVAVDSSFLLHGWEYPADAFNTIATERVVRLDAAGQVLDVELILGRLQGLLKTTRLVTAERLLGQIASAAHLALKTNDVVAIERIGDKVLMPPMRVFREGEAVTESFADHRRLVETALPDYPVPDEVRAAYLDTAENQAEQATLDSDLALLKSYRYEDTVDDLYDYDDEFASALNRLVVDFEYPDYSHMTVGEVLKKLDNDRLHLDAIRRAEIVGDDVPDEAPARLESLQGLPPLVSVPAWHTSLPIEGLPYNEAQDRPGGYARVPFVLAEDAYVAMTQNQVLANMGMYAYYLPTENGRNGIVRLLPDDQDAPAPWKLLSGEVVRVGMMSKEQVVAKLANWLHSVPVLGDRAKFDLSEAPRREKQSLEKARKTLLIYTAGRGDIYSLAGNAKASVRAHVMADLLGVERVTQAKSGITAIKEEFYRRIGVKEGTLAAQESEFLEWVKTGVSSTATPLPAVTKAEVQSEISSLVRIAEVSDRLNLSINPALLATDSLRESGFIAEVPGGASIAEMQKELLSAEPFSDNHSQLADALQGRVLAEAEVMLGAGEMPVYRVTDQLVVAVHPSAHQEGFFQVTRFADSGVLSDSQYRDLETAMRQEGLWFRPRLVGDAAIVAIEASVKAELGLQERREAADPERKVGQALPVPESVDVVKNPKVRRARKDVVEVDDRIEDVGEKIGGARKDFYNKALSVEDLSSMNDQERNAIVRKANIWPWSVKEALGNGADPGVVQWIKTLRRSMREFGDNQQRGPSTPEDFITGVAMLRDAVGSPKTQEELTNNLKLFRLNLFERKLWVTFNHPVTGARLGDSQYYTDEIQDVVTAVGRTAFDMVGTDIRRLYDATTKSISGSEHKPLCWRSSKAECYSNNAEWALTKLMPARRAKSLDEKGDEVMPERPHLANLIHSGFFDARCGRDIEASELLSRFGFRAIEFGNWVPQDERQTVINMAFDGMHALCETMGVEPMMASLHGDIALAFGSRGRGGKGAGAAHYETGRKVINLTRINGAGSLMHEWKHAFDHRLGELITRKACTFLSEETLGNKWLSRKTAEELREDGANALRIDQMLTSGEILPTPVWRHAIIAMEQVVSSMTERSQTPEEVSAECQATADQRIDWTCSWIRSDLVSFFRGKASRELPQGAKDAYSEGVETAKAIVQKAMSDHANLEYNGGWGSFNAQLAAEQVIGEVRADFKINLGAKARRNIEGCLRTASHSLGVVGAIAMTGEEKAAFLAKLPSFMTEEKKERIFCMSERKTESFYLGNAQKLDKARSKPYWKTNRELFARAGEQYVFYAMQEDGCQSDYLVHGVEESRFAATNIVGNPYPAGGERAAIGVAMQQLIVAGCQVIREHAKYMEIKNKPSDVGMAA